jgi:hypothetical protein
MGLASLSRVLVGRLVGQYYLIQGLDAISDGQAAAS